MAFLDRNVFTPPFGLSGKFKGNLYHTAGVGAILLGAVGLGNNFYEDSVVLRPSVYQMRMTRRGKVPIKMKFYTPTNPQTVPQEANRQKFADAMSAWGALTMEQKSVYNQRAKKRQMFGWGLFIREYYQAN